MIDDKTEKRFTAILEMARTGKCANCDRPGVEVYVIDVQACTWTTYTCKCGYQIREHVKKQIVEA